VDGRFGSAAPPATGEIHQANQAPPGLRWEIIVGRVSRRGEDRSAQAEVGSGSSHNPRFAALVKHNDFYRFNNYLSIYTI